MIWSMYDGMIIGCMYRIFYCGLFFKIRLVNFAIIKRKDPIIPVDDEYMGVI